MTKSCNYCLFPQNIGIFTLFWSQLTTLLNPIFTELWWLKSLWRNGHPKYSFSRQIDIHPGDIHTNNQKYKCLFCNIEVGQYSREMCSCQQPTQTGRSMWLYGSPCYSLQHGSLPLWPILMASQCLFSNSVNMRSWLQTPWTLFEQWSKNSMAIKETKADYIRPSKFISIVDFKVPLIFKIVRTLLGRDFRQIISTRGLKATREIICTETTPSSVLTHT